MTTALLWISACTASVPFPSFYLTVLAIIIVASLCRIVLSVLPLLLNGFARFAGTIATLLFWPIRDLTTMSGKASLTV